MIILTTEQRDRILKLVPDYFASPFFALAFLNLFCLGRCTENMDNLITEFIREVTCYGNKKIN